jgi:hypothetical protein
MVIFQALINLIDIILSYVEEQMSTMKLGITRSSNNIGRSLIRGCFVSLSIYY